jgi:hypothetical protein
MARLLAAHCGDREKTSLPLFRSGSTLPPHRAGFQNHPTSISGEPLLKGLLLDLKIIL